MSFLIASQRECTSKARHVTHYDHRRGLCCGQLWCELRPLQHVVAQVISNASWKCSCSTENNGAVVGLSTLKIAQLSPDATELPLSKVRLTLASPMSPEEMTAADVRQAMEKAGIMPPAVKVALYFKDEEGDFVTQPSTDVAWPSCGISEGVLKAWFMRASEHPATAPSTPVCACLGPHVHQPSKKRPSLKPCCESAARQQVEAPKFSRCR